MVSKRKYSVVAMDTASATRFVRIMASKQGLRVVFHPIGSIPAPYTNPVNKEIHVESPRWDATEVQYYVWLGKIMHELGHHRGNNAEVMDYCLKKPIDMTTPLGTLMNILGDYINDAQWAGDLEGAHRAVVCIQIEAARQGIEHLRKNPVPPGNELAEMLCKVFAWIYMRRAETFQPQLMGAALEWAKAVDYSSLLKFNAELETIHDGQSTYDLCIKILNSEGQSSGEGEQPGEGEEGEGEEGEGEGEGDKGGEGEKDGEGKPKKGKKKRKEGKGSKPGEGSKEKVFISYRKVLLADDHSPEGKAAPVVIDYDHDWADNYEPAGEFEEIDLARVVQ